MPIFYYSFDVLGYRSRATVTGMPGIVCGERGGCASRTGTAAPASNNVNRAYRLHLWALFSDVCRDLRRGPFAVGAEPGEVAFDGSNMWVAIHNNHRFPSYSTLWDRPRTGGPVFMALRATRSDENAADHKKRWAAPRDVFDGAHHSAGARTGSPNSACTSATASSLLRTRPSSCASSTAASIFANAGPGR